MFYDNLKAECERQGLKITPIVLECGGNKGSLSGWKKGASPNSDIVMKLSVRLNVSTDELLFGKNKTFSAIDLSHSSVGAIGKTFEGTVNIHPPTSLDTKTDIISIEDELSQEVLRILRSLPLNERTKLLSMIYRFEEDYKNTL